MKVTKSRYQNLTGKLHLDSNSYPKEGDILTDNNTILRFHNGYLDGGDDPAVDCEDTHHEFWIKGQLSRFDGPAVISENGTWHEYWENGQLLDIKELVNI